MSTAKERYEQNVQEAMALMVQIMLENKDEKNRAVLSGKELYDKVYEQKKFTRYVMNEASGRLKAIGFHDGTRQFRVDELRSRTDGKKYYYQLHPGRVPDMIPFEEQEALLQKRERILANKRDCERRITEEWLRHIGFFEEVQKNK